jgi:hypothetical protein
MVIRCSLRILKVRKIIIQDTIEQTFENVYCTIEPRRHLVPVKLFPVPLHMVCIWCTYGVHMVYIVCVREYIL